MLGSDPEARTLKLKAMETKDMVPFATELARRFPELPGSGLLLRAGQALQRFNWISDHCGRRLQASDVQELMATLVEHVACMEHLDVELLPKHHLWTHMVRRSLVQGNFTYYANWVDEDINGVVAIICRSCHAQTFERRVLQKFKELQRMRQLPRKIAGGARGTLRAVLAETCGRCSRKLKMKLKIKCNIENKNK